ncbi:UNVERIFIED_CONTAM: hypothetical protein K2H54_028301 [Gekko kuhli]
MAWVPLRVALLGLKGIERDPLPAPSERQDKHPLVFVRHLGRGHERQGDSSFTQTHPAAWPLKEISAMCPHNPSVNYREPSEIHVTGWTA